MLNLEGYSFSEVYKSLLEHLVKNPEYQVKPRNEEVNEIMNCELKIQNPSLCLYQNERRSSQFKYIAAELLWYLSGDKNIDFISQYSKFWKHLVNRDDTVNSNYGWLLFFEKYSSANLSQWEWAYQSLVNDKDTRQAIMHFNLPKHQFGENKDFVCTMYGDFLIRNNELHFTIHMRSNDVILGLPTDIPFFCLLQMNMWNLLRNNAYPELGLGTYTHFVNSMHLYSRNFQLVKEMLENEFTTMRMDYSACEVLDERGKHDSFVERFIDGIKSNYELVDIHNTFQKDIWNWLNL